MAYGPHNPHPLSLMRNELVWEGKYDEFGRRREPDAAGLAMPLQKIETIDEPRSRAEGSGALFDERRAHRDDFRNRLIWGDNRLVMASIMAEFKGAIDLIYIDPPFDVGADFTLQAPIGGDNDTIAKAPSALEMVAYRDTWGRGAESYLATMYERLALMRDLLSERGSLYVHCDWRMAAKLRALLDDVFGADNFQNEIVWQSAVGDTSAKNRKFIKSHDTILSYRKTEAVLWNDVFQGYSKASEKLYKHKDEQGRYRIGPVDNPGGGGQRYDLGFGEIPPAGGYRMPKETALRWLREGTLIVNSGRVPGRKLYMGEGVRCRDVWTDISGSVRKTYPTEKPEGLAERIISASSDEDSLVADFFCGAGTTGAVAERLGRQWIMADLGRFAVHTARKRSIGVQRALHEAEKPYRSFDVFNLGRYERQWWQREALRGADDAHRAVVLGFFGAEILARPPAPALHGRKGGAFVHVDGIDSIFTREEARGVARAAAAAQAQTVHCLAWDFEMDIRQSAAALEAEFGVRFRLHRIPREIMEKNRKDPPPFFEMAMLEARPVVRRANGGATVDIELTRFVPELSEVPAKELELTVERAFDNGFDFLDFWAVDFDWAPGRPFNHHWQDYRTRGDRALKTTSAAAFRYPEAGPRTACVKAVDVFGNDTSIAVEVTT